MSVRGRLPVMPHALADVLPAEIRSARISSRSFGRWQLLRAAVSGSYADLTYWNHAIQEEGETNLD